MVHLAHQNKLKKNDVEGDCPQCGTHFVAKASLKKKFCSKPCYRQYMADRFDRWIASPEQLGELQNFDEFLSNEELPCLVEGCDWTGKNLSQHMNFTHGVPARDFKMMAGFNLTTGVVCPETSLKISSNPHIQDKAFLRDVLRNNITSGKPHKYTDYKSAESIESQKKCRAVDKDIGPNRKCKNCKNTFIQSTKYGKAKYCSKKCQSDASIKQFTEKKYPLKCNVCKTNFNGGRAQYLRDKRGKPVVCGYHCRGVFAMS